MRHVNFVHQPKIFNKPKQKPSETLYINSEFYEKISFHIDSNEDTENHQATENIAKNSQSSPMKNSSQRSSPNKRQNFTQSTSISATADESSSSDESTDSSGSSSTLSENDEDRVPEMVDFVRSPLSQINASPSDNKFLHAAPSAMTRPGSSDKSKTSCFTK